MTSNIVLPNLVNWAKNHITSIIATTTQADLDTALNAFLSKNASITVNGVNFSRDQYKTFLQGEKLLETTAAVTFSGEVVVPTDPADLFNAGSVGLFYTAVVSEAILVHDSPVQHQLTSSINVLIEEDPSIPVPTPPTLPGGTHPIGSPITDRRRVMALNQVIANGAVTKADL